MATIIKQARSSGPGSTSIIRQICPDRDRLNKIVFCYKEFDKIDSKSLQINVDAIKCSPESDGTTTYVQKKEWDEAGEKYKYPPYVLCEYVN